MLDRVNAIFPTLFQKKVNNYISTKSSEKYKCLKKLRYKLGNAFLINHDKIN